MLRDQFYTITDIQTGEKNILSVTLNSLHPIFGGHFPGNPIVPGVCLTQMIKESVEYLAQKSLVLVTGDNLKFTAILNPEINPNITLTITLKTKDNGLLQAEANVTDGDVSFFSFKGTFR